MTLQAITFQPMALRSPTAFGVLSERTSADGASQQMALEWRPTAEINAFRDSESDRISGNMPVLGATGRDKLQLSDLRKSPQKGRRQACARLTGNRMWLTVSALAADIDALGDGTEEVASLWLAAAVAIRERAMESGHTQRLWLVGLDDTQLLEANAEGWISLEEVATGLNRLIDLVQKELSLHFRSSAFDLLFNEDFEWEHAPTAIVDGFVAPLKRALVNRTPGEALAVIGLGPRLAKLVDLMVGAVGMVPWQCPALSDAPPETRGSLEAWLLYRSTSREGLPSSATAVFDGAPLLLASAPATETQPSPDAGVTSPPAPTTTTGGRRRPRQRKPRFRGGWLRHNNRRGRRDRSSESSLRKVLFVIGWVTAVALAGHLLVEQGTERARMTQ